MSYRQISYDPLASIPGRARRPFNWVQWLGVGIEALAVAWLLLFAASEFGWLGATHLVPQPATILAIVGAVLVGSRREEPLPLSTQQQRRNGLWLKVVSALLMVAGAILLVGEFA